MLFALLVPLSHRVTTSRYQEYVERFRSIFSVSPSLPVYYLPGNHDVGLGNGRDTSKIARSRYRAAFGPLAQHVVLGGHSLLMVDAAALVDEDWRREQAGENRIDSLPQDLNFLKHLRMQHAPGKRSSHLHTDKFLIIFFASRCTPDPIVPHPALPSPQLELRPTPREGLHSRCPRKRLPNTAQPRDVPTPPRRVPPIAHFQVF